MFGNGQVLIWVCSGVSRNISGISRNISGISRISGVSRIISGISRNFVSADSLSYNFETHKLNFPSPRPLIGQWGAVSQLVTTAQRDSSKCLDVKNFGTFPFLSKEF